VVGTAMAVAAWYFWPRGRSAQKTTESGGVTGGDTPRRSSGGR
jgi:hypothetical protein